MLRYGVVRDLTACPHRLGALELVADLLQHRKRLLFGGGLRVLRFLVRSHITQLVDGQHNAEIHGHADKQEVDDGVENRAEGDGGAVEGDRQHAGHVRNAADHTDQWADEMVHDRVDHGGDGGTHDHADCHVDHRTAGDELLKPLDRALVGQGDHLACGLVHVFGEIGGHILRIDGRIAAIAHKNSLHHAVECVRSIMPNRANGGTGGQKNTNGAVR